jgi:hypothetical protein
MIEPGMPVAIDRFVTNLAGEQHRAEVEIEGPAIVGFRDIEEGRVPCHTGTVDENIERVRDTFTPSLPLRRHR